jgi:hypothetical protein
LRAEEGGIERELRILIYTQNLADDGGKPLDGTNKYTLHFDKTALPPVSAFLSITLYDDEGFQVENEFLRRWND